MTKPKSKNKVTDILIQIQRQFSDQPEQKLMCGVVRLAIQDFAKATRSKMESRTAIRGEEARRYLLGDIYHAEACGVDSGWIRSVIRKAGFNLDERLAEKVI